MTVVASAGEGDGPEMSAIVLLPPSVGVVVTRAHAQLSLCLPWYLQVGTVTAASRGERLREWQLGLAPTLETDFGAMNWSLEVGIRRRWPGTSLLRFGVGAWHRVFFSAPLRPVFEPEAVLFIGRCCAPGSIELSLRARLFGDDFAASARVGFSYW